MCRCNKAANPLHVAVNDLESDFVVSAFILRMPDKLIAQLPDGVFEFRALGETLFRGRSAVVEVFAIA